MNNTLRTIKKARMHIMILISIVIVGAFLRFVGTNFGLPVKLHPDEMYIVDDAARLAGERSFETKVYNRPNHISIKANALMYMFIDDVKYNSENAEAFQDNFDKKTSVFYLASRFLSALLSTICIIVAYILGRQFNAKIGLLSAGLFAVFPSFVEHAHYITPESVQLLFLLLTSLFAVLYIKKPSFSYLCLMSITAAIAICEKYPSGYFCITIAFSIIYAHHKEIKTLLKRGILAVVTYVGSIFLISPVLLLDYKNVFEAIQNENHAVHLGADKLNGLENFFYYFRNYFMQAGTIIFLLAIVGVCYCMRKYRYIGIILLLGCLYIMPLSLTNLHWERWGVPMYAHMLILSAIGSFYTFKFIQEKIVSSDLRSNVAKKLLEWVLIASILVVPFFNILSSSLIRVAKFVTPDTRIVAIEYCAQNDITEENTYFEGYTPLRPTSPYTIFDHFEDYDITKPKDENISYVILSSGMYGRHYAEPERYHKEIAFYESLKENCKVKKVFTPVSIGASSWIEVVNISKNIAGLSKYAAGGQSGGMLIIYEL